MGASTTARAQPAPDKGAQPAKPDAAPKDAAPKAAPPDVAPPKDAAAPKEVAPDAAAKPAQPPPAEPSAKPLPPPPPPSSNEISKPTSPGAKPTAPSNAQAPNPPPTGFSFGSYGRMIAATDLHGRPGRDANIVAHGSRLDEGDYVELELRRDDAWVKTNSATRLVATLAIADPMFHYNGDFAITAAVRNLYMEERDLMVKGLSMWVGSRMYRGDDIYLLDWWPLDNLNTIGAGVRFDASTKTSIAAHVGVEQPATGFFSQIVPEANVFDQPGEVDVPILNRQVTVASLKLQQIVPLSSGGAGLKAVLYGELHELPSGQEQTSQPNVFETLPQDSGFVIGGQFGAFTGHRDTHVNLFVRYARGFAAYPDLTEPFELAPDKTTSGAHEFLVALGANYEIGPFGIMLGAYMRSFRDASPALDFGDVDEGIVVARPAVFFGDVAGLAVEGSYQAAQRGVLSHATSTGQTLDLTPGSGPLTPREGRIGVIPFLTPSGRGDYARPQFRVIYCATFRNAAAKSLYPLNDVFSLHDVEHFLGIGAEWWFNSTSYGG